MLRGNHEFEKMGEYYGFQAEAHEKFSDSFFYAAVKTFDTLPIAAVVNRECFCVHGGLSPRLASVRDIRKLPKVCDMTMSYDDPVSDLLWGDPSNDVELFKPGARGCGYMCGPTAVKNFLGASGLRFLIRAHEACQDGMRCDFEVPLMFTVFSSSNYCDFGNTAAVLRCEEGRPYTVFRFPPVKAKNVR
jgi:diadenosine tetraphosphatase ApaH/serine/threonine PP2A family protein phosphatase